MICKISFIGNPRTKVMKLVWNKYIYIYQIHFIINDLKEWHSIAKVRDSLLHTYVFMINSEILKTYLWHKNNNNDWLFELCVLVKIQKKYFDFICVNKVKYTQFMFNVNLLRVRITDFLERSQRTLYMRNVPEERSLRIHCQNNYFISLL